MRKSELADKAGISRNQVGSFFKGKSLQIHNVDKLCKVLDLVLMKMF